VRRRAYARPVPVKIYPQNQDYRQAQREYTLQKDLEMETKPEDVLVEIHRQQMLEPATVRK
jgi:hypothetical protein